MVSILELNGFWPHAVEEKKKLVLWEEGRMKIFSFYNEVIMDYNIGVK